MNNDRDDSKAKPRIAGRPSKADAPEVPWDEIDQLLVHGEVNDTEDGGSNIWQYPSYRDLATRHGVSHSLIARYAKNHNCLKRREAARKHTRELSDAKLVELRADQITVGRDDIIRCIDRYLVDFEEALRDGRVRCDNPSDFNTMIRLRAFAMGDADSRHEELGGITLEDMQRGHARLLATEERIRQNPAITGMVYCPTPAALNAADDDDGDDNDGGGDGGGSGPLLH